MIFWSLVGELLSTLLLVYSMWNSVLESSDLLQSQSSTTAASHITIILISVSYPLRIELKARNPHGAVELFELFFPSCAPLSFSSPSSLPTSTSTSTRPDVSESESESKSARSNSRDRDIDRDVEDEDEDGDGDDNTVVPDVKSVTALAKALVRIAYPDTATNGEESDKEVELSLKRMPDCVFEDLTTPVQWQLYMSSEDYVQSTDLFGSIGYLKGGEGGSTGHSATVTSASTISDVNVRLYPSAVKSRARFALP